MFYFPMLQLALYVLSFLSPKDLLRAGQTCQYWRTLTEDTLLWKQKCKESGADLGSFSIITRSVSRSASMHYANQLPILYHNIHVPGSRAFGTRGAIWDGLQIILCVDC